MAHTSKRVRALRTKVERTKAYAIDEAIKLVKEAATAKFNESIDAAVNLGVDARKSDQLVRGSLVLPQGTGKSVRVAVFTQGEPAKAATAAGADLVGLEDLAAQVKEGKIEFDIAIATPDAMRVVGQLGQILRSVPSPQTWQLPSRTQRLVRYSSVLIRPESSIAPWVVLLSATTR